MEWFAWRIQLNDPLEWIAVDKLLKLVTDSFYIRTTLDMVDGWSMEFKIASLFLWTPSPEHLFAMLSSSRVQSFEHSPVDWVAS